MISNSYLRNVSLITFVIRSLLGAISSGFMQFWIIFRFLLFLFVAIVVAIVDVVVVETSLSMMSTGVANSYHFWESYKTDCRQVRHHISYTRMHVKNVTELPNMYIYIIFLFFIKIKQ